MQNDRRDVSLAVFQIESAYESNDIQIRFGRSTQKYIFQSAQSAQLLLKRAVKGITNYSYYRVSQHDHDKRQPGKVFEFLVMTESPDMYIKFSVGQGVIAYSFHPSEREPDGTWTRKGY